MKLTTLGMIALMLTTMTASKCDEDIAICTVVTPTDQMVLSVTPADPNVIPEGAYLLRIFLDDKELEIEWSMSNSTGRSPVTVRDKTQGDFQRIRVLESGMLDATITFTCPGSPLAKIDATLFLNGVQISNLNIEPDYPDDQPTEPAGDGCGKCWRTKMGPQTMVVPVM